MPLQRSCRLIWAPPQFQLGHFGWAVVDEIIHDILLTQPVATRYFKDQAVRATDCFVGEVGLTGEVRRVSRIEQRVIEAAKLGFKRIFIPSSNIGGWDFPQGIEIVGVETIKDALNASFREL